eukprot:3573798-Alexandrium_andersonii.AAC.1
MNLAPAPGEQVACVALRGGDARRSQQGSIAPCVASLPQPPRHRCRCAPGSRAAPCSAQLSCHA